MFQIMLGLFTLMLIYLILINRVHIATNTMAIVMAFGIFTRGVLANFFGPNFLFEQEIGLIVVSLWICFAFSIFKSLLDKKFKEVHFSNPINRFGIGTWVAGTSISIILLSNTITHWTIIAKAFSYLNFIFWLVYVLICIRTFFEIVKTKHSKTVHGVILLTTVSTQSIVLLNSSVNSESPQVINLILILIGLCFYFISTIFIVQRYFTQKWQVEHDWTNTNCILHGALSITGLAGLFSHTISLSVLTFIWICAILVFLLIEVIEIYRLIKRIKLFGFKNGIWIYHVSQWSRIFTFCMLFTFSKLLETHLKGLLWLDKIIINSGIWVILSLIIVQCYLWMNHLYHEQINKKHLPKLHSKNIFYHY